jgi:hypothetical protein
MRMRLFPEGKQRDGGAADKSRIQKDVLVCPEEAFHNVIDREVARISRSGRPVLLVLIDISGYGSGERLTIMAQQITSVLASSTREIDVKGWYTDGAVMGILFTEFGNMHNAVDAAREAIIGRLYDSLSGFLADEVILIALYTLPAGFGAREGLPPPLMYDGRRKDAVS